MRITVTNSRRDDGIAEEGPPADVLRRLRRTAAVAWLGGGLTLALLWGQHQGRVVHLHALPFIASLAVTFGGVLAGVSLGLWRVIRWPRRGRAAAWALMALVPCLPLAYASWHAIRMERDGRDSHDLPMTLAKLAGASLMEAQAHYLYPGRLETRRLVMFYDDRVTDPRGDLDAMDRHVARMEGLIGLPPRAKLHWTRGRLLGRQGFSLRGLAVGTWESPASRLDRHELAHAVLGQHDRPDTEPPRLLSEGWAVAQAILDSKILAGQALEVRRLADQLGRMSDADLEESVNLLADPEGYRRLARKARGSHAGSVSYLRELTDPFWYDRGGIAVYHVGGALADFILREHGARRFLDLYSTCRPETFEDDCRRVLGVGLDALDEKFWADAARAAGDPGPPPSQ